MTVCFGYVSSQSDVQKYDRRNTAGMLIPDGKISTADIELVWPNRRSVGDADGRELCYAFEAALAKRWFYDYAIVPVSRGWTLGVALPRLLENLGAKHKEVLSGINEIGQNAWMDEAWDKSPIFTSAKVFVNCTRQKLTEAMMADTNTISAMAIVNQCGSLEL